VSVVITPVPVAAVVAAVVDALDPVMHGPLTVEVAQPPLATAGHWRLLDGQILDDVEVDDAAASEVVDALRHARHTRRSWQGDPADKRHQGRALHPRPDAERLGVLPGLALILDVVQGAALPIACCAKPSFQA
jgi:hypothetical protein